MSRVFGQSPHSCSPKGNAEDSSDTDVGDEVVNPRSSEKRVCAVECEMDWVEPSLHFTNSIKLQPHGLDGVLDAFHLLQTEPSVQVLHH